MDKFVSELVNRLDTPISMEQSIAKDVINLSTNENPYPPNPKVLQSIKKCVTDYLMKYPLRNNEDICNAILKEEELPSSGHILIGNNAKQLMASCYGAFFNKEKQILIPDITSHYYSEICNFYEINYLEVPTDENMNIKIDDYMIDNGGIVFSNPNRLTGMSINSDKIIALMTGNKDSVVIIDETYIGFGGQSVSHLINKHPNLVVIKSMEVSHSLAGMSCSYVLARPELINAIKKVNDVFNPHAINTLEKVGMITALEDHRYKTEMCEKIIRTRQRVKKELISIRFNVLDSKANFLFVEHKDITAKEIYEFLKDNFILVKYSYKPEKISNYLRISMGTDKQMDNMISKLSAFVSDMYNKSF